MSTISSLLLNNAGSAATSSSMATQVPASTQTNTQNNTNVSQNAASQTTYTPSVANQLAGLTYTSAGLLHSGSPQTPSSAQAAYRAAQDAITQAQNDLMSSGSSSTTTDLFGASNTSKSSDPLAALTNANSAATSTDTKAQTALKAYSAAQDAVTQSQAAMLATK